MEILEGYFNSKKQSYCWLLAQIERITHIIRAQLDQMVKGQLHKIGEALKNASRSEVIAKVGEMTSHHNANLQKILQIFISSMKNLSQGLNTQPPSFKPNITIAIPIYTKSILVNQPHNLPANTENKAMHSSPQKNTQPIHSLFANDKPEIRFTSVKEQPKLKARNEDLEIKKQQSQQKQLRHLDLMKASKKRNEQQQQGSPIKNEGLLAQNESQSSQNANPYARSCLQLDHKIYNEANEYLNSVLRSKQKGMTPSKNTFLQRSPITKLEVSRRK